MTINVRTKGAEGEREVAKMLNAIVATVRSARGLPKLAVEDEIFQRNQNQSAVGGSDLTCPMPLEIEVKRQEALSINTWWKQTVASANRTGGIPILIFRQNRKKWRVCMLADIPLQPKGASAYQSIAFQRVEMDLDTFKSWFKAHYEIWLNGSV